eukprot:TRINITY_DN1685_c0_g1_i1.p1 TRINITY_DN1685_c0_g1~~TRINITY_DN1685_c0_g1_i1.p1  ORF type:complete len:471 (+),score=55.36 TRINITY_DN1685_c0_g1_i1:60-1415(+)
MSDPIGSIENSAEETAKDTQEMSVEPASEKTEEEPPAEVIADEPKKLEKPDRSDSDSDDNRVLRRRRKKGAEEDDEEEDAGAQEGESEDEDEEENTEESSQARKDETEPLQNSPEADSKTGTPETTEPSQASSRPVVSGRAARGRAARGARGVERGARGAQNFRGGARRGPPADHEDAPRANQKFPPENKPYQPPHHSQQPQQQALAPGRKRYSEMYRGNEGAPEPPAPQQYFEDQANFAPGRGSLGATAPEGHWRGRGAPSGAFSRGGRGFRNDDERVSRAAVQDESWGHGWNQQAPVATETWDAPSGGGRGAPVREIYYLHEDRSRRVVPTPASGKAANRRPGQCYMDMEDEVSPPNFEEPAEQERPRPYSRGARGAQAPTRDFRGAFAQRGGYTSPQQPPQQPPQQQQRTYADPYKQEREQNALRRLQLKQQQQTGGWLHQPYERAED